MHRTIISDTSCLIILSNIGEIELLKKVYGHVLTTAEVADDFGELLPDWIKIVTVKDKLRQQLLEMQIDKGESSAIALALETEDAILIIDDFKARRVAEQLRLNFTGTIGVIVKAKLIGEIESIIPILSKIKATNFRISNDLEVLALSEANEL
jgi:predicted nucleic acid-binding protein